MKPNLNKPDSLYKVTRQFLKALKVPVSRSSLRRVLGPTGSDISLATLTDAFKLWNIESIVVRLEANKLNEIDLPAIAHVIDEGEGHFVMLTKLKNGHITYLDSQLGNRTETLNVFARKWDGITMLAESTETSGELDFNYYRRQEILTDLRTWLPVVIAILCIGWGLIQPLNWESFVLVILKIIGIVFSIILLWEEYGPSNLLLAKICQVNSQTDCRSVLNSPAAKLFGWLGMAEVGLTYFMGGLLTLVLSAYGRSLLAVMPFLALFNVLALPYTLFSIYYQGWVVKKWCPICVSVQVVLWMEFIIDWTWLRIPVTEVTASYLLILVCYSIPVALWLLVKPLLEQAQNNVGLTSELARFRENTNLFQALLNAQPVYNMNFEANELILGHSSAPVTLTMVSGPFCEPCKQAHKIIEHLLDEYPNELRVVVRFAVDGRNENDPRNLVAQYLLALAIQKPHHIAEALATWYQNSDIESLAVLFPVASIDSAKNILHRQIQWCFDVGIQFTPTYFVNNRPLPSPFTLNDIRYHIHQLAEGASAGIKPLR